jgi:hypothetical protein
VQIVYVVFFPLPFTGDSATYLSFAQAAIEEHTYYPNPSSIYNAWLIAPVFINYTVLLLKVWNNASIILFSNILLNLVQLFFLYKVTQKLFDTRVAIAAAIIYILYLNNLGLVLHNLTELPFGIMIMASIYFYISPSTRVNNFLCGLTAALAIGIRPTGWALVLAYLIIYVIALFRGKASHVNLVYIMSGILLFITTTGLLSKRNIGRFEYTSTTGPANLIMSANPHARGVFDPYFFNNDSTYLTKKTYFERDQYLMESSRKYIAENFWTWVSLMPRKIYSTFISDGWSIHKLLHSQKWDLNAYLKANDQAKRTFHQESLFFRISFWILNIWQQLLYGLIAAFFLYQVYDFVKGRGFTFERLLINLFIIGGLAMTLLFSVGTPRYKYNFLITSIILISPHAVNIFDRLINFLKLVRK